MSTILNILLVITVLLVYVVLLLCIYGLYQSSGIKIPKVNFKKHFSSLKLFFLGFILGVLVLFVPYLKAKTESLKWQHQWEGTKDSWLQDRDPIQTVNYVRCPKCLKENIKNVLHNCMKQCRAFLINIGKWEDIKETL